MMSNDRMNGATGVSDMAGEAARVAVEDAGAAEIQMNRTSHNYYSLPRRSPWLAEVLRRWLGVGGKTFDRMK